MYNLYSILIILPVSYVEQAFFDFRPKPFGIIWNPQIGLQKFL